MPRYLVERSFPNGLEIPTNPDGQATCKAVIGNNGTEHVTWIHSYVAADHTKTFCIYDAPSPEAVRRAAAVSELPVDSIAEVSVLDPYFYVSAG